MTGNQTLVYIAPPGNLAVVESGGTIQVKSGGVLQIDAGATFTNSATETFTGALTFTGGLTITTANLTITDVNIVLGTTTGTQIGTGATQKVAFYGATPIVQPATHALDVTGFVAGTGTATKADSSWAGPTGATAYGVGDIVKALKALGLLAA